MQDTEKNVLKSYLPLP